MSKRYRASGRPRLQHFIKNWRVYRDLTQEQLADRLSEYDDSVSAATVSRIERGQLPYTQDMLEAIAYALQCEPADLIMRNPLAPDAIWSIADNLRKATPEDRQRAADVIDALLKRVG